MTEILIILYLFNRSLFNQYLPTEVLPYIDYVLDTTIILLLLYRAKGLLKAFYNVKKAWFNYSKKVNA